MCLTQGRRSVNMVGFRVRQAAAVCRARGCVMVIRTVLTALTKAVRSAEVSSFYVNTYQARKHSNCIKAVKTV